MKFAVMRIGLALSLAGGLPASALFAEATTKALPTLLIKGEVVSLDANDPSATLLKVKDRYGFETPIFVTPETKISQGDAASTISSVTTGSRVEVEYSFDINTAKRHAVSVKLAAPTAAETPAAPAAPASIEATAVPSTPAAPEAAIPAAPAPEPPIEPAAESIPTDQPSAPAIQ